MGQTLIDDMLVDDIPRIDGNGNPLPEHFRQQLRLERDCLLAANGQHRGAPGGLYQLGRRHGRIEATLLTLAVMSLVAWIGR